MEDFLNTLFSESTTIASQVSKDELIGEDEDSSKKGEILGKVPTKEKILANTAKAISSTETAID